MPGFAPTQGHIPSGVPFLAHAADMMAQGKLNRVMIVGKGSLFLGRLTNLFDGVSFILEKNKGETMTAGIVENVTKTRVGLTLFGSEHGEAEMLVGAEMASRANSDIEVVVIGSAMKTALTLIEAADEKDAHAQMDAMLKSGALDAAVTMHYNFPIGVSTVGRVITPGRGKSMYVANTTGTSDTQRTAALIKNAIQGVAVARACGNPNPTVGVLNIDGARTVERALLGLQAAGYDINLTQSAREGATMRGNDLLQGTPDIMVMDSLTGNVIMKTLSAFTTGGSYESIGDGYGPGVGQGYDRIINIISRASGAPVVAGAIAYAAACAKGGLIDKANAEFAAARKAGLDNLLAVEPTAPVQTSQAAEKITAPPEKIVTEEIAGIEILELEDAVEALWKKGIYATSGMGCTGPIVLVAPEDLDAAKACLKEAGYL